MGYMDPSQGVSRGYPGGCRWILRWLDSKMAILGSFWTPGWTPWEGGLGGSKRGPEGVILDPSWAKTYIKPGVK